MTSNTIPRIYRSIVTIYLCTILSFRNSYRPMSVVIISSFFTLLFYRFCHPAVAPYTGQVLGTLGQVRGTLGQVLGTL